jgi:FkbM family methyltransferase
MKRHKPLLHWILGKKNNVSLFGLLKFTFSGSFENLGKRKLTSLVKNGDDYEAKFQGFPGPIYWPSSFPLSSLYQIAAELLYKNWWNYETYENSVDENDCVIDCGAAEGAFTLMIANRCKKVFAIEPHPKFVESMKRTLAGLANVEIIPIGVGSEKGKLNLSSDGIMSQLTGAEGIEVEIDTIDNRFFNKNVKVDFIKADLEGFELKMLEGAEMTIKTWEPRLSITTYHFEKDFANTKEFLHRICPKYTIKAVGLTPDYGTPIMLHAWIDKRNR